MSKYSQGVTSAKTRFSKAPMGVLEFSKLYANPTHLTDFNAGDIVPIYCQEVLPHETVDIDLDFVIRQSTIAVPTMGQLEVDFYAFEVPNRVVNHSWKEIMGENSSGAWANEQGITLATIGGNTATQRDVQVPVGSVADYYGYPTQRPIPKELLAQMHDLKLRGMVECFNSFFRDQNYQPPVPYSKLNIFNGFFAEEGTTIGLRGYDYNVDNYNNVPSHVLSSTGQAGEYSVVKAIAGQGSELENLDLRNIGRKTSWSALSKPFKANKFHDYFTSVLPYPQKSREVVIPLQGGLHLNTSDKTLSFASKKPLGFTFSSAIANNNYLLGVSTPGSASIGANANGYGDVKIFGKVNDVEAKEDANLNAPGGSIFGTNLYVDPEAGGLSLSVDDIRMSSAMQQVYEILGRGGSRYVEYINSFFGLEIDNPFDDMPTYLGHFRRSLDLFQTAQTSATPTSDNPGTAQGNLAAYGYTANGGKLVNNYTFKEHGYLHIFAVVRHRNVYSSMLSRDNFRLSMMDFYQYPLANISEQPVYSREINPFSEAAKNGSAFGFQEAWAEYRYEPDRVSGYSRPGVDMTLAQWNYADDFDETLSMSDSEWLRSNSADVVRRSTATQDLDLPQFKGQFMFRIKKQLPMPTYSVAGLDII